MTKLSNKKCIACEFGSNPLSLDKIRKLLTEVDGWKLNEVESGIYKHFKFGNYYKTIAFVNAVAWVANNEGHHPKLEVGFNYCTVHYSTHAAKGLTENDFICASKIDVVVELAVEI